MKLLEYEAKKIFGSYGIPVPRGVLIHSPEDLESGLAESLGDGMVLKAQVDVGGRGKAGGILMTDQGSLAGTARDLFGREIKGIPVREVLVEERISIEHEYYVSIAIDRSSRKALILFADSGGVEIESVARENPDALRKASVPVILHDVPAFMLRELRGDAPKEVEQMINRLYRAFCEKDALLAEINPLVSTPSGIVAADAKLIVDDNALKRQGIEQNRDLSERERIAEEHGFSYVELDGEIGVIGNGAGLTMATLDLIEFYRGKAANFLDVGGGADQERVRHAVSLVAGVPSVRVIIVNLLGGITRCDDVARGIVEAGVHQQIIVRLAGTNEDLGKEILAGKGYRMMDSMEDAVRAAVEESR